MKSWAEIGFEVEITGDGSPSLRLLESLDPTKDRGEAMHHSGGACSETLLIYGQSAKQLLQTVVNPRFIVVGLGLGYIEMTLARESLLTGKALGRIVSYESVAELRESFWKWLHNETHSLSPEIVKTYEMMAESVAQKVVEVEKLKKILRDFFPNQDSIRGALQEDFESPGSFHGFMYDAFSSKTTPHLWEEDFLYRFLSQTAEPRALLATYACRGSLKRALQRAGFEVIVQQGFQGKRNSTLALRGFAQP